MVGDEPGSGGGGMRGGMEWGGTGKHLTPDPERTALCLELAYILSPSRGPSFLGINEVSRGEPVTLHERGLGT